MDQVRYTVQTYPQMFKKETLIKKQSIVPKKFLLFTLYGHSKKRAHDLKHGLFFAAKVWIKM